MGASNVLFLDCLLATITGAPSIPLLSFVLGSIYVHSKRGPKNLFFSKVLALFQELLDACDVLLLLPIVIPLVRKRLPRLHFPLVLVEVVILKLKNPGFCPSSQRKLSILFVDLERL